MFRTMFAFRITKTKNLTFDIERQVFSIQDFLKCLDFHCFTSVSYLRSYWFFCRRQSCFCRSFDWSSNHLLELLVHL